MPASVAVAFAMGVPGVAARAASVTLPAVCAQTDLVVTCAFPAADSGQEQVLPVPAGATSARVTAVGAAGGTDSGNGPTGPGGEAAIVTGTVPVQPGSNMFVEVGGTPTTSTRCEPRSVNPCVGGWNGGGTASLGAGGGGGSDVRTVSRTQVGTLDSRLIVAGGGGGSGPPGQVCAGPPAGGAGGAAGLYGTAGSGGPAVLCNGMTGSVTPAGGGTQSGGGVGGETSIDGGQDLTGNTGTLGAGAPSQEGLSGGGGGGYWGGGSGADDATNDDESQITSGGGGGGGSSLLPPGGSAALTAASASVTVIFSLRAPAADLAVRITAPDAVSAGSPFTTTVTVTNDGPGTALAVTTAAELPRQLVLLTSRPVAARHHFGLSWTDPVLMPGQRVRYAVRLQADAARTTRRVWLRAVVTALTPDPSPVNNSTAILIAIRAR